MSAGVVQTSTTVVGSPGNDTIDCGGTDPGKTIFGNGGNDTITGGTGADTITGGLGIDTCQGPAPDPDIHASCESTSTPPITGPGSGIGNATALCYATGGVLSLTVNPVGYLCLFNPLSTTDRRAQEARNICTAAGGTFVSLRPLSYTCLLPATAQAPRSTR